MKESAKQVQLYLQQQGFTNEVVELPSSTRTVQEAAEAIGCHEAQIAKSIVFDIGGRALLVVASGPNRVSEERVATFIKATLSLEYCLFDIAAFSMFKIFSKTFFHSSADNRCFLSPWLIASCFIRT